MSVLSVDAPPRVAAMSSMASTQVTHRDRLVTAAARFTAENGWAELTMAKLADLVGVSRQTVYNEIGGKPQLAEAMVLRELELFLQVVDSAFQDNPDDLVRAIEAAALAVLEESPPETERPKVHAAVEACPVMALTLAD